MRLIRRVRRWFKICLKLLNSFHGLSSEAANHKFNTMKRALFILITAISALTIAVPVAQADGSCRIVSYTSCGRPIYARYQVVGYDRCGQPIGRWVTESSHCGCEVCNPRPRYDYRGPSCDHDQDSHSSHGSSYRSGGFYFSFGR